MPLKTPLLLLIAFSAAVAVAQTNTTPTYPEVIEAYRSLAKSHPKTSRLLEYGMTDAGLPLHLLVIDPSGKFDPANTRKEGDLVWLVLNGIHAGEPCGIDASLAFAKSKAPKPEPGVVYLIVPVYNVGGALMRNSTSRVNQQGPEEYGFRGSATNYDLNRDFVKKDTPNSFAFAEIFHLWQPHILLDTHTSNGADYQPNMTLVHTLPERLHRMQAMVLTSELVPQLYAKMGEAGEPMVPYVNTKGDTPESGLMAFTDLPRYSTGYAALWGTIGFMSEAHMLKPYPQRVQATLTLIQTMDAVLRQHREKIVTLRNVATTHTQQTRQQTTQWRLTEEADSILFAGYRAERTTSEVTGMERLRYNRDKPFAEKVPYYNMHEAVRTYTLPEAYIIPQGWTAIIGRLKANGIKMETLRADTAVEVTSYYVEEYTSTPVPYEGHYAHRNTHVSSRTQPVTFRKGDVVVKCNQPGNMYLAYVLDPLSDDSFFNWNFFDAVLMQKEYYSDYLFEDTAAEMLRRNPTLSRALEEKKRSDPEWAKSARNQLDFIYQNSKYHEPGHNRIPTFRLEGRK